MHAAIRASLSIKMKIPITVLVSTLANLFIRDLRSRGESSIESVVDNSVIANKLRGKPLQTLAELITRLENPLPNDYWPGVEYGLALLLFDVSRILGISTPKDVWRIDHKHRVEWFKWVYTWSQPAK